MYSIMKPSIDIVPVFLKIYSNLQEICSICSKVVFAIVSEQFYYRNNNKNNSKTVYWSIAMSNDGSSIKIIDQSHGD